METRTFISYSRDDSEFVLRLVKDLDAAGIHTWLDQRDIPTGSRWDSSVQKGLDESSQMLLVLSPTSAASQNVLDEAGYALGKGKRLIPILLESCEVPFRLRRLQYVDFTGDRGKAMARLVQALDPDQADPDLSLLPDPAKPVSAKRGVLPWVLGAGLLLAAAFPMIKRATKPDSAAASSAAGKGTPKPVPPPPQPVLPVTVPPLIGLTVETAARTLKASGLKLADGQEHEKGFDAAQELGVILASSPAEGTSIIDRSVPVVLTLNDYRLVPDLVDQPLEAARDALQKRGLTSTSGPLMEYDRNKEEGIILAQNPSAETRVPPGQAVSLSTNDLQGLWILGNWQYVEPFVDGQTTSMDVTLEPEEGAVHFTMYRRAALGAPAINVEDRARINDCKNNTFKVARFVGKVEGKMVWKGFTITRTSKGLRLIDLEKGVEANLIKR